MRRCKHGKLSHPYYDSKGTKHVCRRHIKKRRRTRRRRRLKQTKTAKAARKRYRATH